jgi:G3E family GTPase
VTTESTAKKRLNIVTGFLGSGKTSLIMNYLNNNKNKDQKILVLINEIGKENFDKIKIGKNVDPSKITTINVPGGCICCSSKADFSKNLFEIAVRDDVDRVIIEPSGLARVSDILDLIENTKLKDIFLVQAVICVTNPQWPIQANELWRQQILDQLNSAQIVVSNFNDTVDPTYEIAFEEFLITKSTPKQKFIKTSFGRFDPEIFDVLPDSEITKPLLSHVSTKGFTSTQMVWPKDLKFSFDVLCNELMSMKTEYEIVRMKSYFHTDRGWFCFEMNQDSYFCEPTEYRIDQRIQTISTRDVNWSKFLHDTA